MTREELETECEMLTFEKDGLRVEIERLKAEITVRDKEIAAFTAKVRELEEEIRQLKRGEFICMACGLRKNADAAAGVDF